MSIITLAIPVLETERLILRGHCDADFAAMCAIWQDPVVLRYFGGKPQSREEVWARYLKIFGSWAVLGYGFWAVIDKASGDYAGGVGAFQVKREMAPLLEDMPEVGWCVASRFHGRGYATEAMQAALAWTDEKLGHPAVFCIVAPANVPSIRVAEKCGFNLWYNMPCQDDPALVLRRDPPASQ